MINRPVWLPDLERMWQAIKKYLSNTSGTKATPVDTDYILMTDSADTESANGTTINKIKRVSFANLSAAIFEKNSTERLVKYYSTSTGDCNNITDELHLGGNGSAHYPIVGSNIWWYVHTFWYGTGNSTGKQIAYGYNGTHKDRMFTRVKVSGTWYDWVEVSNIATSISYTYPSSLGTFAGNVIRYTGQNRIFIDGTFTVATGKSISANVLTTIINITEAADRPANATGLSIYYTQSYYIMGYQGTSGNIALRSGGAIPAGATIYIGGSWTPSA